MTRIWQNTCDANLLDDVPPLASPLDAARTAGKSRHPDSNPATIAPNPATRRVLAGGSTAGRERWPPAAYEARRPVRPLPDRLLPHFGENRTAQRPDVLRPAGAAAFHAPATRLPMVPEVSSKIRAMASHRFWRSGPPGVVVSGAGCGWIRGIRRRARTCGPRRPDAWRLLFQATERSCPRIPFTLLGMECPFFHARAVRERHSKSDSRPVEARFAGDPHR